MPNRLTDLMTECERTLEDAYGENKQDDYSNIDFDELKQLLDRNSDMLNEIKKQLPFKKESEEALRVLENYNHLLNPVFITLKNRFRKLEL
jgi:hypothetical protein